jgi:hypothetical protein
MTRYGQITQIVTAVCLAAVASSAGACAIPVFRYALERWYPDDYLMVIVHRGPLDESDQGLVDRLQAARRDSARPANLQVTTFDVAEVSVKPADADTAETPESEDAGPARQDGNREALLKLLTRDQPAAQFEDLKAPQMILLFSVPGAAPWQVWSGPLSEVNIRRLIDSPTRQTIVERILAGDSAVWVLIASGDKAKDDQAEATLRAELARIEKMLTLPAQELLEAEQEFRPETPVQLRIGFSLVRLQKDDAEEAIFRAMLLASEADLVEYQEQPIAVPIYGRGRTCFALVGKGIHADTIEENCRFLCDGCSCVIKQQNPGIDMLFAVNWDARVDGTAIQDLVLPELTGIGALAMDDRTSSEPAADPAPTEPSSADPGAAPPRADTRPVPAVPTAEPPKATTGHSADPAVARSTAAEVFPPSSGNRFARRLLVWTLAGAGVATLLFVLVGAIWMRSHGT